MGFLTVETMTIMGLIISELITSEPNKALLRLKDCSLRILFIWTIKCDPENK